jgi:uncharacterized membrane protein
MFLMSKKRRFTLIPRKLKARYSWGDIVPASCVYECSLCGNYEAFKKGEHFSQCQDCINSHEIEDNKWYVTNEFVYFISKNINIEFDRLAGFQIKVADKMTEWAGSLGFVYLHILWFAAWISMNMGWFGSGYFFDPFPFGLLTMIVSLEAIFLATFIMISQNISSQKSELRAEHEYQVNLETEKNVAEILVMIKDIKKEAEFKTDALEDIKETIEEIVPEQTVEDVPLEAIEKEHFEEQEQLLEDAGVDMIAESAPPMVLEEKKKRKKRNKNIREFGEEFIDSSNKIIGPVYDLKQKPDEKAPENDPSLVQKTENNNSLDKEKHTDSNKENS